MSSVIDPSVDVAADVASVNAGEAERKGDTYTIRQRRYRLETTGRVYPVDGPGIHPLGRGAYKALQLYNEYGDTEKAVRQMDFESIKPEEREIAVRLWRLTQK